MKKRKKMGRPKLPKSKLRVPAIGFRPNREELRNLKTIMERLQLTTMSEYFRKCIERDAAPTQ